MGALGSGKNGESITPCGRETSNLNRGAVRIKGLGRVDQAIEAWARALEVLPAENLAPAEKKQRDQYSSELATAKAKLDDLQVNPKQPEGLKVCRPGERWRLPWERAIAILPDLAASQTWNSSVRRIYTYLPFGTLTFWLHVGMGYRESIQGESTTINPLKFTFPTPRSDFTELGEGCQCNERRPRTTDGSGTHIRQPSGGEPWCWCPHVRRSAYTVG